MTTREVRDAIVAEVGFGPDAAKGMDSRVTAKLLYLAKVLGTVCKTVIEKPRRGRSTALKLPDFPDTARAIGLRGAACE